MTTPPQGPPAGWPSGPPAGAPAGPPAPPPGPPPQPYGAIPAPPPGFPPPPGVGGPFPPGQGPRRRAGLWILLAVVAVLLLAAIVVGAVVVLAGDDGGDDATGRDESTGQSAVPPTVATEDVASPTETVPETTSLPPSPEDVETISGLWVGSYVCNQGQTRFRVEIEEGAAPGQVEASFTFRPSKANRGVPDGKYLMEGTFEDDSLVLEATRWVTHPDGYVTVDMQAIVAEPDPARITGQIDGPGCTTFSMKPHAG